MADKEPKKVTQYQEGKHLVSMKREWEDHPNQGAIIEAQKGPMLEKTVWKHRGAKENEQLWRGRDGGPLLPTEIRARAIEEADGLGHVGIS